jgi:methylglutaconyl-CoA hydratase
MAFVQTENRDEIFKITLCRPDVRNAFHPEMIQQLTSAFLEAHNSKCRLVYLSGQGKSFCSGADLEWMKSMKNFSRQQNLVDSEKLHDLFEAGRNSDLPILTKVQGHVMGGALGLVAVSDFVGAIDPTAFCFSEVKLGLAPAVISPFVLSKMQISKAREWMLSGQVFSAQDAQAAGLVSYVGNDATVDRFLKEVATQIFAAGPEAVRATKKLLRSVQGDLTGEVKNQTTQVIADRRVSNEGQQGLAAFFTKSAPSWKKDFHGKF